MNKYDKEIDYCRMLGHSVPFSYCRTVKENMPCFKIMDCWFEKIDIESYLKEYYSEEEIKIILSPPKPKVVSIYEMIQQAQTKKGS